MNIYYENTQGKRISLSQWPLVVQEPERLFSYQWNYDTTGDSDKNGRIKSFFSGITEKPIPIAVFADNEQEFFEALELLHEITVVDILARKKGRLYIDDQQYMSCYIYASEKEEWDWQLDYIDITVTLLTDYPFWITEQKYLLRYIVSPDKLFLDYPYDYPYDYASEHDTHRDTINNTHYSDCHFLAIFYGPCTDPSLVVDAHPYSVTVTLEDGEYLRLDTRDRTITKVTVTGDEINEFNNQRRDVSIFEKITPGMHTVTWNGTFGVDMILYEERSEPKWS